MNAAGSWLEAVVVRTLTPGTEACRRSQQWARSASYSAGAASGAARTCPSSPRSRSRRHEPRRSGAGRCGRSGSSPHGPRDHAVRRQLCRRPEHGPYAVTIRGDRASESIVIGASQVALARTPFERYAHASETERLHRAEDPRGRSVHLMLSSCTPIRRSEPARAGSGPTNRARRRSESAAVTLICSHPRRRPNSQSPERRVRDRRGRRFP